MNMIDFLQQYNPKLTLEELAEVKKLNKEELGVYALLLFIYNKEDGIDMILADINDTLEELEILKRYIKKYNLIMNINEVLMLSSMQMYFRDGLTFKVYGSNKIEQGKFKRSTIYTFSEAKIKQLEKEKDGAMQIMETRADFIKFVSAFQKKQKKMELRRIKYRLENSLELAMHGKMKSI